MGLYHIKMGELTDQEIKDAAEIKATKEAKAAEIKAAKEAKAEAAKAAKEAKAKNANVKVNFGVFIAHMKKAYTIEEIEADEEAQEYLLSIGSSAVTKL